MTRLYSMAVTVPVLLLLLAGSARAGELSFDLDAGDDFGSSDKTLVFTNAVDVRSRGFTGHGARDVEAAVHDALTDAPEGTRVRIVIGQGTEGSVRWTYVYPRSVVALDGEDRSHGVERLALDAVGFRENYRLIPWRHGQRHGIEKEYIKDQVRAEIPWENGNMHGMRKSFYSNGNRQSETAYVNGVASGPTRTWDQEGALLMEGNHEAGSRHGLFIEYWPGTKQPRRHIHYLHGAVEGTVREFHATGELRRERTFVAEMLHGKDQLFQQNGDCIQTRYWYQGDPVTEEEFRSRTEANGS